MKTPKEILLQRHEAVEPKLDAVRRRALATLDRRTLAQTCREFLFSMRWHLAGMSVVWMAALLLQIESTAGPTLVVARGKIPSARVLWAALVKNRLELIELTEMPPAGEPAALPPRRSENQCTTEIV